MNESQVQEVSLAGRVPNLQDSTPKGISLGPRLFRYKYTEANFTHCRETLEHILFECDVPNNNRLGSGRTLQSKLATVAITRHAIPVHKTWTTGPRPGILASNTGEIHCVSSMQCWHQPTPLRNCATYLASLKSVPIRTLMGLVLCRPGSAQKPRLGPGFQGLRLDESQGRAPGPAKP
ncbi:hypothetical protein L210DRAFT_3552315 [Boletus edulis BED1]|uniref:Uncharacterized protein n=1 Tax=Boletus edulis BED1 TaxID=1328754 RepID=A0AAD4BMP3_BOLED|nr:hypothetical protein L210DRAFT_3552315 [Boletus edulis BED1]